MRYRSQLLVIPALLGLISTASPVVADPGGADAAGAEASASVTPTPEPEPEPELGAEAGCDAAAGGDVEELLEDEGEDRTIETPTPTEWRTTRHRQCRRYHGRVTCDGPLRVPAPVGPAADLRERLGLDDEVRAGRVAMSGEPREEWVEAVEGRVGAGMLWPVPEGRLWRGFGMHREITRRAGRRRRRRLHRGVDIGAPAGSLIRAVNDGLVLFSFNSMRGYGNAVILLHPDQTVTLYAHCQATHVFAGQRVRRGQVIAEVGHTGLAHGDHLHFEWRRNGRPLNPIRRFVDRPDE